MTWGELKEYVEKQDIEDECVLNDLIYIGEGEVLMFRGRQGSCKKDFTMVDGRQYSPGQIGLPFAHSR